MDLLENQIKTKKIRFMPTDKKFATLIMDHKQLLQETGTKFYFTPEDKAVYSNLTKKFLRDKKVPYDLIWIFFIINNLTSVDDLTERNYVILPSKVEVQRIYERYKSSLVNTQ